MAETILEELSRDECLALISPGGIGRVAFGGQYGPTVLPVNYRVHDGSIVFRTRAGGAMDEDLRTNIDDLEIMIAFQIDRVDEEKREGWSVLIQGPAHHVAESELPEVTDADVTPWAGGDRRHYVRIAPHRITGRRITGL